MNTIAIKGRLGADPELRYGPDGKPRLSMRIADGMKRKDGTEETLWWSATVFGDAAEALADTLRKGAKVSVTGRAEVKPVLRKDGTAGAYLDVVFARVALEEEPPRQAVPEPDVDIADLIESF